MKTLIYSGHFQQKSFKQGNWTRQVILRHIAAPLMTLSVLAVLVGNWCLYVVKDPQGMDVDNTCLTAAINDEA